MIFYTFVKPDGTIYKSYKNISPDDKAIPDSPGSNYFFNMTTLKWEEKETSNPFNNIITNDEYNYLINHNSVQNTILLKILNYQLAPYKVQI